MNDVKKIKATISPVSDDQWKIVAHDRSGLEAQGFKPKHVKAALLNKLVDKYGCEIELHVTEVLSPDLQAELDSYKRDIELSERLAREIPQRRHALVRRLFRLNMGQTEIAERVELTQGYVATLLKKEPAEAAKMTVSHTKKPR